MQLQADLLGIARRGGRRARDDRARRRRARGRPRGPRGRRQPSTSRNSAATRWRRCARSGGTGSNGPKPFPALNENSKRTLRNRVHSSGVTHERGRRERGRRQWQARAGAVRDPACDRGTGRDARAGARVPALRRPPADRGRARAREDTHDQDDRRRAGREVPARAVHARPRAVGSHRDAHLPPRPHRVRDGARPRLLQLPARRRDQPRARRRCSRRCSK